MKTESGIQKQRVMTVAIFQKTAIPEPIILVGIKETGENVEGSLMSPGGKVKPGEKDFVASARREGGEETGLIGGSNMRVAELRVMIKEKKQMNIVHVILFTSWTGELRKLGPGDEFKKLEFIQFSKIPWKKTLPGERKWMEKVLLDCSPVTVHMTCGKNRKDLLSITYSPLTYQ